MPSEERRKILEMLQEGKITAEQAERLLSAIGSDAVEENPVRQKKTRWLKVRVYEGDTNSPKVKVNLPLNLIKILAKIGVKFSDKFPSSVKEKLEEHGVSEGLDSLSPEQIEEIFAELTKNGPLNLVEVDDDDDRVEITI